MKRVVLVVCDGLRADMVRPDLTPNLCRLAEQGRTLAAHRSVYPSTTRTTVASIATGCQPGRHGLEGNCMAIDEGRGLKAYSVGPPGFRERLRKATGETLRVPTLSERLAGRGEAIVYSNASAGAALFHDPDGFGYVYHRLGSFGPGLASITDSSHLVVSHDAAGDREMTERFCRDVLIERRPAYAVLWQCEPDHSQHEYPLGSPENVAALASADANAGLVADRVARLNAEGDDILLILASDHGHETVDAVIPLTQMLIDAGLKHDETSSDVVVASNGFSANIYLSRPGWDRCGDLVEYLRGRKDFAQVFTAEHLPGLGHQEWGAIAVSVTTHMSEAVNEFGVPGKGAAIFDPLHTDTRMGCGQHGGLGRFEQNPFLILLGGGATPGTRCDAASSAIDLAPSVLRHLGLDWKTMDGAPLPLA